MNELQIIENKELRNKLAKRYEVLDKVKNLITFSDTGLITTQKVAEYYEVNYDAIMKIWERNNDELKEDGALLLKGNEIKEKFALDKKSLSKFRGKFSYDNFEFTNGFNILLPRRAVLRIGMLLRDSKIAKEVRTQLLNIEEKVDVETKLSDINEEQSLALSLGMALISGDLNAITIATGNMMAFKNRYIKKLEVVNKALSESILDWEDRDKLNSAVRRFVSRTNVYFPNVWNDLYKELKYGYHIDVKTRDKKKNEPLISTIKEFEWPTVIKCFLCYA